MENDNQSKPPSKLPDGRTNPEWLKWYRSTPKGKAALKEYYKSEKFQLAQIEYRKSGKFKETRAKYRSKPEVKAKRRDSLLEKFPFGSRKCVSCGIVYATDVVLERGYKLIGPYSCLCDFCS